ncbi:MAG TPA: TetR/AcrR family transcriptional regulator [Bryobacteraceae bacterium]|nr:TetR/AcrR family transcriptional regulator [Bryobacteraceae bacterium]
MQKKKVLKALAPAKAKRKRRTPAPRRQRRSTDDVLNRIVTAAAEEFRRSGFAGTTTAAIARRADVTEAQLFRHFRSKSNVFQETIFKPIEQHFLAFTEKYHPARGEAPSRELSNLYTRELQHFIRDHAATLTSLVVAQAYDRDAAHGVSEIDSLGTYFDRGAAMMAARLKGKAKVDPRLLVRVTFASVLGSIMFGDWLFPPGLASDEEIADAINEFVLAGSAVNSAKG